MATKPDYDNAPLCVQWLSEQIAPLADAQQIGRVLMQTGHRIEANLVPVLGQEGVDVLCQRSLALTRQQHAWLVRQGHPQSVASFWPALQDALAAQSPQDALAASCTLLENLQCLLAQLIGASLTLLLLQLRPAPTADTPGTAQPEAAVALPPPVAEPGT